MVLVIPATYRAIALSDIPPLLIPGGDKHTSNYLRSSAVYLPVASLAWKLKLQVIAGLLGYYSSVVIDYGTSTQGYHGS